MFGPLSLRPPRWRRLVATAALILAPSLSGCLVGTVGGPRAVPEVTGMLAFSAYPNATLITETGSTETITFADRPGRYASRVYETADSQQTVARYYEALAAKNGWAADVVPEEQRLYAGQMIRMSKDKFNIAVFPNVGPEGSALPYTDESPVVTTPFRFRIDVWLN